MITTMTNQASSVLAEREELAAAPGMAIGVATVLELCRKIWLRSLAAREVPAGWDGARDAPIAAAPLDLRTGAESIEPLERRALQELLLGIRSLAEQLSLAASLVLESLGEGAVCEESDRLEEILAACGPAGSRTIEGSARAVDGAEPVAPARGGRRGPVRRGRVAGGGDPPSMG